MLPHLTTLFLLLAANKVLLGEAGQPGKQWTFSNLIYQGGQES